MTKVHKIVHCLITAGEKFSFGPILRYFSTEHIVELDKNRTMVPGDEGGATGSRSKIPEKRRPSRAAVREAGYHPLDCCRKQGRSIWARALLGGFPETPAAPRHLQRPSYKGKPLLPFALGHNPELTPLWPPWGQRTELPTILNAPIVFIDCKENQKLNRSPTQCPPLPLTNTQETSGKPPWAL